MLTPVKIIFPKINISHIVRSVQSIFKYFKVHEILRKLIQKPSKSVYKQKSYEHLKILKAQRFQKIFKEQ